MEVFLLLTVARLVRTKLGTRHTLAGGNENKSLEMEVQLQALLAGQQVNSLPVHMEEGQTLRVIMGAEGPKV